MYLFGKPFFHSERHILVDGPHTHAHIPSMRMHLSLQTIKVVIETFTCDVLNKRICRSDERENLKNLDKWKSPIDSLVGEQVWEKRLKINSLSRFRQAARISNEEIKDSAVNFRLFSGAFLVTYFFCLVYSFWYIPRCGYKEALSKYHVSYLKSCIRK